jgi:hypothetical protein
MHGQMNAWPESKRGLTTVLTLRRLRGSKIEPAAANSSQADFHESRADTMNAACPHCGGHVLDDGKQSGQVVACPFCDKQFQMPSAEARAAAEAAAASPPPPQYSNVAAASYLAGGPDKPWQVPTLGVLRIVSGVLNVTWGLGLFIFVVPLLLIPFGIMEIMSGANLLAARPKYPDNNRTLAILEIVSMVACNPISFTIGILALVFSAHREVEAYFASLSSSPFDSTRPLAAPPQQTATP